MGPISNRRVLGILLDVDGECRRRLLRLQLLPLLAEVSLLPLPSRLGDLRVGRHDLSSCRERIKHNTKALPLQ